MKKFEYAQPKSIDEVFQYLEDPDSVIKSGGIDLLDLMKEDLIAPKRLVNIRSINQLSFVRENEDGTISIGPNVTLSELADNEIITKYFPALREAARLIATPQIRNAATIGGNLCQRSRCWYFRSIDFDCSRKGGSHCYALFGENKYHAVLGAKSGCAIVQPSGTAVALMSLNAVLVISNGKNEKQLDLNEFYVEPAQDITKETILENNELIVEIIIPKEMRNYKNRYIKLKEKQSYDWPLADVAVALKMNGIKCEEANVILGSAAPIPWKSKEAEFELKGNRITKELARKAGEASMEEAFPLAENKYKIRLFKIVVYRAICEAIGINPYT
ncbi:MAG: xanthine dehydrogenase family protein subunit M [Bacteroidetes bacterium]|nr:xanthine dehydrogenase family protein subunit M [Bacteroidota bacterium]